MALLRDTGRKFILILIELGFIMITGIIKHFLHEVPADAMIWGSISATGLYFGVNFAQKKKELENENND